MRKTKTSAKYQIVGRTSDGVEVLKPKMTSGHLGEIRSKIERVMAENRKSAVQRAKPKTSRTNMSIK